MISFQVKFTNLAESDLAGIITYIIKELYSPEAALSLLEKLERNASELNTMPLRYPLLSDGYLRAQNYRQIVIDNYSMFYTMDEVNRLVWIERVLYSKRNWQHIL